MRRFDADAGPVAAGGFLGLSYGLDDRWKLNAMLRLDYLERFAGQSAGT